MVRRRSLAGLVGVTVLGLAVAGCSSGSGGGAPSAAASSQGSAQSGAAAGKASAADAAPADLSKFYDQQLKWTDCGDAKCADLTVPVDYAKPGGPTIKLAIDKVPATGDKKGSLVVNPGGPGGSGVDYAAAAASGYVVSKDVRSSYDVVGFDPRGVQRSAPITCYGDAQMDRYLAADPTPDDAAEQQQAAKDSRAFGDACVAKTGNLIKHVSTVEVAKDMDVLRAALGDDKLNYLGKSYGTFIGSTYADLFPKHVGRFVLDGVVPPDITGTQMGLGQAKGFEQATRSYVRDCVASGSCPLGANVDDGMARIRSFLKQVDAKPLKVTGEGDVHKLTEGWATMGIAQAMYDKGSWPTLTDAFRSALNGNGNKLMALADQYAERSSDGSYSGNIMQVINAVNCLDRGGSSDLETYRDDAKTFAKAAPTWGPMLAWGGLACGEWPVKATGKPERVTAKGSGPILVVGTTRDPATPYEWAQRLAKELDNGHLLTYDGDGHTAYKMGSSCVDGVVDDYLVKGTVPAAGKAC
ncbi:proteinase [Flexivirga endophytica]|uniref:Proteinase n=1 Tax=Flexivirga endophytica TaxID=1849103 RepID=A0A916WSW6_9MICO|nr:alpha/beta hydrolase [Flexivirga endophytica]GGB26804.1 proteinase [Flexivirga endophytica]GHB55266.1 proteinase [Flexivirga endophytica]